LRAWFGATMRGFVAWLVSKAPGEIFGPGNTSPFLHGAVPYGYPPARGSRELLQVAKANPWLYAATTKISTSVGAVRWRVYAAYEDAGAAMAPSPANARRYRAQRDAIRGQTTFSAAEHHQQERRLAELRSELGVEELPNHPLMELLDNPNPMMSGAQLFELTQRHLSLVGEAFWIIERGANGLPARLWPVPNFWVTRTPSDAYTFFDVIYAGVRQTVPQRDMVWLRHLDPANPYARGSGAGQALGDEIETDEYAGKVAKAIFVNGSTPAGIVAVETSDQKALDEFRQAWDERFRGVYNAMQTAFLGAKAKFLQLSPNFADQGILDLRKAKRDDFRGVYGVPPELLGIVENSNRATIEAAQSIFAVNTLVPELEFLRRGLEHRLLPEYGNGSEPLALGYDTPVPEDREHELAVMTEQPGCFTKNEWRKAAGKGPRPGWDDEFPGAEAPASDAPPAPTKGTPARQQVVEVAIGPEIPIPTHRNGVHKRGRA